MSKGFIGVLVAVIVIFVGLVTFNGNKAEKASGGKTSTAKLTSHIEGKGTSGVTILEYGDYQCPYCQQYAATVKQVKTQYGDKIKFQFRNFPLVSLHHNAFAAARAAEAADQQGKFWEMHDLLYETSNWQAWSEATDPTPFFKQYAGELNLNTAKFSTDFASSKVNDLINADMAEGNKLGITGTPTFFVDGKQTQIANDPSAFQKVLDGAIAKKAPKTAN